MTSEIEHRDESLEQTYRLKRGTLYISKELKTDYYFSSSHRTANIKKLYFLLFKKNVRQIKYNIDMIINSQLYN